jgi:hypothetical protein
VGSVIISDYVKVRYNLKDLDVDWMMILKRMLAK